MINLWSQWNNVIIYTCFEDFVYLKNLSTNHKKVFYLYDLNWHKKSLNYKFTMDALLTPEILFCRSTYHADKIEEYCGRRPIVINKTIFEETINAIS